MRPVKSFFPLASWLLRVAVVLFAIMKYFHVVKTFDFSSLAFYAGVLQILFSFLLFIGGFFSKHTITVISSLVVFLVTLYHAVVVASAGFSLELATLILYGSVALYFLTSGNEQ
jgi:hypothetical protein